MVTAVSLSHRRGGDHAVVVTYPFAFVHSGDWSGWRDVFQYRDEQKRTVVCATAVNWSHDQPATKRLTAHYNDATATPNCGDFSKIVGSETAPGHLGAGNGTSPAAPRPGPIQ